LYPIIDNTPDEEDLKDSMAEAMKAYPDAAAVLVCRHGVYVWGPDWEKAKTQAECLDYLFEMFVKMKLAGISTELLSSPSSSGLPFISFLFQVLAALHLVTL